MEARSMRIYSKADRTIYIDVVPGHFATNHSHVNFYVNMTALKTAHRMAKNGAAVLAGKFNMTPVDTIICLEGTEMVGAFLADALSQNPMAFNSGVDINVLTPEVNANNQLIFRENTLGMVAARHVLLLLSSVSTGKTINRMMECLQYYQGNLAGIGALFSATNKAYGMDVQSVFGIEDMSNYQTYLPGQCALCSQEQRIDAIVNSFGYSKI